MNNKPNDAGNHEQRMSPDKRDADKAAMPSGCPTTTECRASACHGGCLEPSTREAAEHAYYQTAFDYAANPVGSRDWSLFWRGWQAYEQTGLHKPSDVVSDLSKTVMRLALALRRADPTNDFADKALDYLKRKKLTSPLRPGAAPFHPVWGVAIGSETPSFTDKPVRWMSREDWDAGWKQSPVYHEPLADDDVPLYARPQGAVSKSALPQPSPDHREVMRQALEALTAWDATITHQYTGSREAMTDMHDAMQGGLAAIDALRAALGESNE